MFHPATLYYLLSSTDPLLVSLFFYYTTPFASLPAALLSDYSIGFQTFYPTVSLHYWPTIRLFRCHFSPQSFYLTALWALCHTVSLFYSTSGHLSRRHTVLLLHCLIVSLTVSTVLLFYRPFVPMYYCSSGPRPTVSLF